MKNYLSIFLLMTILSLKGLAQSSTTSSSSTTYITVTVMPNPVKNNTVIFKLEGLKNKTYQVKIISDKGSIAATEKFIASTGTTFRMLLLHQKFSGYGRVQILDEKGKLAGQSRFLIID